MPMAPAADDYCCGLMSAAGAPRVELPRHGSRLLVTGTSVLYVLYSVL